jgi:hypothetical protein
MEYIITKGECYIERPSKDTYEIYHFLKDTDDLDDVKYESIMITPVKIYNRGVMTESYPFYCSSFKKISPVVLDMIKNTSKGFEKDVRIPLDSVGYDPKEELAPGKCFSLQFMKNHFEFARVDWFEEVDDEAEGICPIYALDKPGGEVHGEFIVMADHGLYKYHCWLLYDEYIENNDMCRCTYPSFLFDMVDDLLTQRLQYFWNLFKKYLHNQNINWGGR